MNKRNNMIFTDKEPLSTDFCMLDYECAYLPQKSVRMYYKHIEKATQSYNTALIHRGWRRFGSYYFHPICNGCNECKSIRIDANNHILTKSQRKSIKRNRETKIIIRKPTLTQDHIDLYNKYHAYKHQKDNWSHRNISPREYQENFVDGAHEFGKEVLYLLDGKIIGIDLIDILDDGISSIYFFYDPDYPRLSLGTYSLLYQIELAKILELPWIYLGYWVEGCKAFAYKPKFKPQEILSGFPPIDQVANWQPFQAPE
jgi:arginine-tRNA-protein transferase